jgi:arabinose operon protein AraL
MKISMSVPTFAASNLPANPIDGFIFDLDGTIYLGEALLPGAAATIAALRAQGKRVLFISNKPLDSRQIYADKLTRLGIPTQESEVLTSAYVLARYLSQHTPDLRYYVIGEESFCVELRRQGVQIAGELDGQDAKAVLHPEGIDGVIVAFDRTLDYRKLNTAYQALQAGARFFATNADKTCPFPGGAIPDAGATLAALHQITGRTPELIAGKPSPLIIQIALDLLQLPAGRCLIAGDRLETDMRMGHDAGMVTALVLTGVTGPAEAATAQPAPDLVLQQLDELLQHLGLEA